MNECKPLSAGAEFAKAEKAWSRGDTDDARIKVTRTIKAGPAARYLPLHTSPQTVSSCHPVPPRAVCPVGTRPETTAATPSSHPMRRLQHEHAGGCERDMAARLPTLSGRVAADPACGAS